ncbi:MAG: ankyrin repeat domain-containing protein [Candidatus Chromulinivorax sp.]
MMIRKMLMSVGFCLVSGTVFADENRNRVQESTSNFKLVVDAVNDILPREKKIAFDEKRDAVLVEYVVQSKQSAESSDLRSTSQVNQAIDEKCAELKKNYAHTMGLICKNFDWLVGNESYLLNEACSTRQEVQENLNASNKYGHTALIEAAAWNRFKTVNALLAHDRINVNAQAYLGYTALMKAIFFDKPEAFKLLLGDERTNVNAQDNSGWTVLMNAAYFDKPEAFKLLLGDERTDVNAQDNNGWTVLMKAVRENNVEMVKALLSHEKIDVNASNKLGNTALIKAVFLNKVETLKVLLAADKIDVNLQNKDGRTALNFASDPQIVDLLRKHGAR